MLAQSASQLLLCIHMWFHHEKSSTNRTRKWYLSVLLLGLVLAARAQQPDPAVSEIVSQLREGNMQQALELANTSLTSHPENCQVLSLQAVAFAGLHQQDSALHSFQRALTKCPGYLPALEGAAQIDFSQHSAAAAPLLRRILAIQPDNIPAHAMLASALQEHGDCAASLPHFAASEPLFDSQPVLRQNYANCLAKTGDLANALQQYTALVANDPSDANHYNLAVLQWRNKNPQQALATLEPVLNARQFGPAFALGSRIAESLGDTPRAVDLLRTAILLAPDELENYLAFANLAFAHTSFQVGIDVLNAGLQHMPNTAQLYLARGVLEMQLSKQDEAIADFQKAHQLDRELSLTEDALGIVQTQQHQNTASLSLFQQQARLHPDDPILQYLLAEQLSEGGGDPAPAIAAARQSTKLDPHYSPAHDLLAKLYVRSEQPKLAIEQSELALTQNPDDEEALYQEMMAQRRMGTTAKVQELSARFKEARKKSLSKQASVDRYRLVEPAQQ